MKNCIKRALFCFLVTIKIHHLFRFINRNKIAIVMYHGIVKETMPIPCWWQLPFEQFKWQLAYLKKYYTVMHLRDVIKKIQCREALPDNVAIITFDDGFENNYSVAYSLLRQLNLPATIYLTTDYIGTGQLLCSDEIFILFLETKVKKIDLRSFGLDFFDLRTIKNKQEALNIIDDKLKTLKSAKKKEIITYIKNILSTEIGPTAFSDNFKLLSWEQVSLMNESGLINWGAHTCTHEILSNLDDKTMNDEIRNSCARINKYSHQLLFAYPNGRKQDFNERAKVVLKKLNVLCSVTTIPGLNSYFQDPYELKRIGIGNDTSKDYFKLLCSGAVK